jgi:hypothetical protein
MARSEHLPIYKASYDLCLYFEEPAARPVGCERKRILSILPPGYPPHDLWLITCIV